MSTSSGLSLCQTRIEVVAHDLLEEKVPCIMLSANNKLDAGSGQSLTIERLAGPRYLSECEWLSKSAGPSGIPVGTAVMTGGASLASGDTYRYIIQAVTIAYDVRKERIPASPEIVYRAVREGLEKAEAFRIPEVATYLMALRPGYRAAPEIDMASAFCRAILDHAEIARSVKRIVICESDPQRLGLAKKILEQFGA